MSHLEDDAVNGRPMRSRLYRIVARGTRRIRPPVRYPLLAATDLILAQPRPVLVYQMAKVGSTSVCATLQAAGIHALHIHYLSSLRESVEASYRRSGASVPKHLHLERFLRPYLRLTSHRLRVITLVRDPIARFLSSAFQTEVRDSYEVHDTAALLERLRRELLEGSALDYCYTWFDRELATQLGVDVFAHDFDRVKGYSIIHGPRVDVLTLKLERLKNLWPTVGAFVGRPLEPIRANERSERNESASYSTARDRLRFPSATVAKLYDHRWMRHFYTQDEIDRFVERWSENASGQA